MVKKRIKPNRNNLSPPTWWRILLLFALAAGCIVFGILALQSLRVGALGKYAGWMSMLACVGVAALVSFIIVALCNCFNKQVEILEKTRNKQNAEMKRMVIGSMYQVLNELDLSTAEMRMIEQSLRKMMKQQSK